MPTITCPSCATSYELPEGALGDKGRKVKCATCGDKWHAKPVLAQISDPVLDSVATGFTDRPQDAAMMASSASMNAGAMAGTVNAGPMDAGPVGAGPVDAEFEDAPTSFQDPIGQKVDEIGDGDLSFDMAPVPQEMPRKNPINPIMRSNTKAKRGTARRSEEKARRRTKRNKILQPVSLAATLLLMVGIIVMRESVVRAAPDLASYFEALGMPVNLRGFEVANLRSERVIESGGPVLIVTGDVRNVTEGIAQVPPLRLSLKTNTNEEIYAWTHTLAVRTIVSGGKTTFQSRLADPPSLGRRLDVRFTDG